MPETLRLFVALELPPPVLDVLKGLQARLQRDAAHCVRWVRPGGIHLTLKFLGEVPASQKTDIIRALEAAADGHPPLALQVAGLGCFPNTSRPRVVWAGLAGDLDALEALQRSTERALSPLGFPPEKRGFSPHLTLGRVQRSASPAEARALGGLVAQTAADLGDTALAGWTASGVGLIRSELERSGARYTRLFDTPLRG
ncbi:MAG: RNA 2',3'-cyclic phosphodiesterase [Anaerolineae bacterium]|nr:RNA 2',3'-cyclic phosphodiesterase [Anaerolineae bacterium]